MKAEDADLAYLRYPGLVSPKLDGFRGVFQDHSLVTNSLKAFANRAIRVEFQCIAPLDGELIAGDPTAKDVFRNTSKIVTAHDADIKNVKFYVFDRVGPEPFSERLKAAHDWSRTDPRFVPVEHVLVRNEAELLKMEDHYLEQGYEGMMWRDPNGKYKYGRSTVSEGWLLKIKRFLDSEAHIVDFEEQMHNANEATINKLGYTERSSHQANKQPLDALGALVVRDLKTGVEFNIGTGFSAAERAHIWKAREEYKGAIVKYKYLPVGVKDKPRHPAFLGFRPKEDL